MNHKAELSEIPTIQRSGSVL